MPGFLPGQRPNSGSYGGDMVDEDPVAQPSLETSAVAWNNLKADLAFLASVSPLAVVHVRGSDGAAFDGTKLTTATPAGSIVRIGGAFTSLAASVVTITRVSTGVYLHTLGASAGFVITTNLVSPTNRTAATDLEPEAVSATQCRVRIFDGAGLPLDADYYLELF